MTELVVTLLILAGAILIIWPAAQIAARLGFSPFLGILSVVPVLNVLALWFVAYSEWPKLPSNN